MDECDGSQPGLRPWTKHMRPTSEVGHPQMLSRTMQFLTSDVRRRGALESATD